MSILSDFVHDIASLLFPARCAVCGEPLARGERTVCTFCRATAPLTGYWNEADNPVARKCWGLVPVERASGFLFFVHASGWRRLIHGFKYRGAWRTAREMGRVVRAAPETERALRRCRGRGSDAPASFPAVPEGLQPVGIPRRGDRLAAGRRGRPPQCPPQAQYAQPSPQITPRPARNVEGAFAVRRPERLAGRHVLLVDDVMTTGNTLLACAAEILRAAPGCRVSIAAFAVSRHEMGVKE